MQSTRNILLIRPAHFGYNAQTAASNSFQQNVETGENIIMQNALDEFDNFAATLRDLGLGVYVFDDTNEPLKPDAIFPNNWISFHSNGTIVLYPMHAPNRRAERRLDIIDTLKDRFLTGNIIDLSHFENEGKFLEGTGSIVFDHDNKVAYASLSPRTNKELFLQLCTTLAYKPVCFHSYDKAGQEIYHTNVMMCIAPQCCILCTEGISDPGERQLVTDMLRTTGHKIAEISLEQMKSFAGNMLALQTQKEQLLVMSQCAFDSLTEQQKQTLSSYSKLLPIAIPTIESIGGGSARCMIAEIFLPAKD